MSHTESSIIPSRAEIEAIKADLKLSCAEPGTFEWALLQMKAGKKVRRMSHPEGLYWAIFNDQICTFQEGNGAAWLAGVSITDPDARASDWQLYAGEKA